MCSYYNALKIRGFADEGTFPSDVRLAIDYFNAEAKGVQRHHSSPVISDGGFVVFSAGNGGQEGSEHFPAYYADCISVGSTSGNTLSSIRRAPFSNWGLGVNIAAQE